MKEAMIKAIEKVGVIPVINIKDVAWAAPLSDILTETGFPALEVTLRSESALAAIHEIRRLHPEMILSAGTVFTAAQADAAIEAGADFLVTPGYEAELVAYCAQKGYFLVPGCATPSEIQTAMRHGITVQKLFPAELSGGVAALKLYAGAFTGIRFVPTGGITLSNLASYLKEKCVLACGGSFMAPAALLEQRDWESVRKLCLQTAEISAACR